jgi:DNA polymerase III subunit delta
MPVKYPNAKQFKRDLDSDRLERMYLFLGEEEGEKDKCINRIIVMAFNDPAERVHATGRFHIENDEFLNAADFALSPSMFSSRRLCVMYNMDGMAAKHGALFQDMMQNLPDTALLIMTSREIRPPAFMTAVLEKIHVVQFWRYYDSDIHNYVTAGIRKLGLVIDDRAVDILIGRTGNDIKKIDDAIDMIRFSGETGKIGPDTIMNFIDDLKEASVYDFVDALFRREPRALPLARKVIEDGTPDLRIIYQVLRVAEMIETYFSCMDGGMGPEEAMNKAGVYSKNRDRFRRYAEIFSRERLKRVFALISRTDYRLKSGGASKGLLSNPVFTLATDILYRV